MNSSNSVIEQDLRVLFSHVLNAQEPINVASALPEFVEACQLSQNMKHDNIMDKHKFCGKFAFHLSLSLYLSNRYAHCDSDKLSQVHDVIASRNNFIKAVAKVLSRKYIKQDTVLTIIGITQARHGTEAVYALLQPYFDQFHVALTGALPNQLRHFLLTGYDRSRTIGHRIIEAFETWIEEKGGRFELNISETANQVWTCRTVFNFGPNTTVLSHERTAQRKKLAKVLTMTDIMNFYKTQPGMLEKHRTSTNPGHTTQLEITKEDLTPEVDSDHDHGYDKPEISSFNQSDFVHMSIKRRSPSTSPVGDGTNGNMTENDAELTNLLFGGLATTPFNKRPCVAPISSTSNPSQSFLPLAPTTSTINSNNNNIDNINTNNDNNTINEINNMINNFAGTTTKFKKHTSPPAPLMFPFLQSPSMPPTTNQKHISFSSPRSSQKPEPLPSRSDDMTDIVIVRQGFDLKRAAKLLTSVNSKQSCAKTCLIGLASSTKDADFNTDFHTIVGDTKNLFEAQCTLKVGQGRIVATRYATKKNEAENLAATFLLEMLVTPL